MTDTPQFPQNLAAALCKVSGSVRQLGKSERNQFAKYDFVSVDKFYSAIGSLMAEHGVHCLPDCIESEVLPGHVKTDRDGSKRHGAPLLRERWAFTLIHESGECAGPYHRTVTVPAEGAQAHGSSESYAQKQFLRGVFRVPTGDKDDADYGDKTEHGVSEHAARKSSAQAKRDGDYEDIKAEIEAIKTPDDLKAWGIKNRDRINALPKAFSDPIRDCYAAHMEDIQSWISETDEEAMDRSAA
jgi:ERF superfamily